MKLIIAGSRYLTSGYINNQAMSLCIKSSIPTTITEVVSGGARGVDTLGENWAEKASIPTKIFPANWGKHGRAAGPMRNKQMAKYADALLLIWDGKSKGSANMKKEMLALNKPVYEFIIEVPDGV